MKFSATRLLLSSVKKQRIESIFPVDELTGEESWQTVHTICQKNTYILSMIVAMPIPSPIHIVTRA